MTPDRTPGRGQADDGEVRVVPVGELVTIARLGQAMRKAQRTYFELRRKQPHVDHSTALREVRRAEERFDDAVRAALQREQGPIPGMGDG